MKIAVLSLWTKEIEEYAIPVNEVRKAYCHKHGYALVTETQSLDPTRHPAWSKLKLIQKVLPEYDYVFWNDADCLIFDHKVTLEEFIDDNYLIQVAYDGEQHWRHPSTTYLSPGINTGNILIKNSEDTLAWIDLLYKHGGGNHWHHIPCWEQSALEQLYVENVDFKNVVKIMSPFDVWNGVEGSFLKHALGLHQSAEKKHDVLQRYIKQIEE